MLFITPVIAYCCDEMYQPSIAYARVYIFHSFCSAVHKQWIRSVVGHVQTNFKFPPTLHISISENGLILPCLFDTGHTEQYFFNSRFLLIPGNASVSALSLHHFYVRDYFSVAGTDGEMW
jgi:hypothetical protein